MSQTEFLSDEMTTARPVSGYKLSRKVVLSHKDHQWGRGLKGKEAIH